MQNILESKKVSLKGQMAMGGGGLVAFVVGYLVFLIVDINVAIPVVEQAITAGNLTGLVATIVGIIPTFLAILPLVVLAALFR